MVKMTLEDLGWKLNPNYSYDDYETYVNGDNTLNIDFTKRKININGIEELSFAVLEAIRERVIEKAIY